MGLLQNVLARGGVEGDSLIQKRVVLHIEGEIVIA